MKQKHCPSYNEETDEETKARYSQDQGDISTRGSDRSGRQKYKILVQEALMGLSDKNTGQLIHNSNTYRERYERHTMGLTLK